MPVENTPSLTEAEVAAMEARCAAATPGQWYVRVEENSPTSSIVRTTDNGDGGNNVIVCMEADASDATLIAAARADLPRLIAAWREQRALLGEAVGFVQHFAETNRCDKPAGDCPHCDAFALLTRIRAALGEAP